MQHFEIIERARSILSKTSESKASQKTVEGYLVIASRIIRQAKRSGVTGPEAIEVLLKLAKDTKKVNTWYCRRAALIHCTRELLVQALVAQDRGLTALLAVGTSLDSEAAENWRRLVRTVELRTDWLEALKNEPPPIERQQRHSKRKDMQKLPEDWRERIIARMPMYRLAVLTEAVTGCRPDELTRGVKLEIVGGELVAEIQGSKVKEKSGQPWRKLAWSVDSDSPLVRMLVGEVLVGAAVAKIEDAKTYSGAVRAAGAREWPKRKASLAPYCFRHQMASDMKASGAEDSDISAALGHCVDVARSYYGQWQQGRVSGGVAPTRVEAARVIRIKREQVKEKQASTFECVARM